VLDQKYLVVAVDHDPAHPQGHAAGDPPIEMKSPPQLRLQALSNILQDRHGHLGSTDMPFESLRREGRLAKTREAFRPKCAMIAK
jgi:hypothetical protein